MTGIRRRLPYLIDPDNFHIQDSLFGDSGEVSQTADS